jgi:hypothetical protein
MGQFADAIRSFQVRSLKAAEAVRKDVIMTLFGDIIFDSAVDTGNFAANWKTSQGAPDLSWEQWGNGRRNNPEEYRAAFASTATAHAYANMLDNLGEGLKRDTQTYLANSAQGGDGDFYGWKIEFGYNFYAWDAQTGRGPPSENVLASGFSRWAPKGMVRINVAKFHEIVRSSVRKHA